MSDAAGEGNESSASLRWLVAGLGLGGPRESLAGARWAEIRDDMRRPRDQGIVFLTDWISDPWLALGTRKGPLAAIEPAWSPPDAIDAWPTFGAGAALVDVGVSARRTRDDAMTARLAAAVAAPFTAVDSIAAITEFFDSEERIARHGDTRMVFGEHVRAWLLLACGALVRGLCLAPAEDTELIAEATLRRLALPTEIQLPPTWVLANEFGQKHIELLLNMSVQGDGSLAPIDPADIRVGQGAIWRESWAWLSREIDAGVTRDAVRLAARLLRNEAVREGVTRALRADDAALRTIAVAAVRRWALTLKAMTWVEDALAAAWTDVRPADVVALGFNAVKPDWPRRIVAISHRSAEVKPTLRRMSAWKSSRWAIDATYVPAWETNTGMIWGLFGPTPAVVRVDTPTYRASVWCRREAELIQYLLDTCDFLADRHVIDVDLDGLRALAVLEDQWRGPPREAVDDVMAEFPPMITVWTPTPLPEPEAVTLRAGGALRAMSAFLRDPELVNALVTTALLGDVDLPGLAPTNNPDGWGAYARIFRDLRHLAPEGPEPFAMLLPADYDAEQVARDVEVLGRVPDLASGSPALDDVLVAVEFLRTLWPTMVDQGYGRFLALNLRGISREDWTGHPQLSLQRGLLAVRTPVPLWLVQTAGQDVSSWELPGDPPILTEHLDAQFGWMNEIFPDPDAARSLYPADSGLRVSAALRRMLGAPD